MPGTVIKLFGCYKCGWIMDEADTSSQKPCKKCDSKMMRPAHPTRWNILRYFWGHPSKMKMWVSENVFKRNR